MRIVPLFFFLVFLTTAAEGQVTISEFLASNDNGLADESGSHEDWLELQNSSGATVNLSGWYLTDDASDGRKWPLPAWTLASGKRLVVFASNQNRRPAQAVAGQDNAGTLAQPRLHTNFKLSASGGYLALNKDDAGGGLANVSVYAGYATQATDVSYGFSVSTVALAGPGSAARALVPTVANGGSALGAAWRGAAEPFDDAAWASGTLGVGVAGSATAVASAALKLRLVAGTQATLANDSSGAGHHGTNTSNTTAWLDRVQDTAATPLVRRGVMQFSAVSSSQVSVPGHTDFDTQQGTITFWMKSAGMSGGGSEGAILWDRRSPTTGNVIVLTTDGRLYSQPSTGAGGWFYSSVVVSDNQWHHVAFVFNGAAGGTDTFYVDGLPVGAVTHGNSWSWPSGQPIELGRSHDPYWYNFNGWMDDARYYNTPLSVAQISQIFRGNDENVEPGDVGLNVGAALAGNTSAYIRVPFNLADGTALQGLRLTTQVNDGFVAYVNGTQIDTLNAVASPAYNSVATTVGHPGRIRVSDFTTPPGLLHTGTNILAIHGLNNSSVDPNFLVLPTLEGIGQDPAGSYLISPTPGAANSGIRTNIGPFISAVTGDSAATAATRPTGSAALTISATVKQSLRPLGAGSPVQLAYRTMFGGETVVNMSTTGGGVYTAQIPTTGLAAGQMLRWRVIAKDNTGIQSTAPAFFSPTDSDQYYGTVTLDGVSTQLPIYQFFVENYTTGNGAPIDNDGGGRGAVFYGGELYDNVFIRIKGDTTRTLNKRSHRVDFNTSHQFKWSPDHKPLRELGLNAEYVDPSYSRQYLSMWLHRVTGTGGPNHFPVRAQMNGTFWQLAFHTDVEDDELLDDIGLDPNGAFYASIGQMDSPGTEKKTRNNEGNTDMANFIGAVTQANLATRKINVFDQVELPAVINYLAVARITQEGDDVWANMSIYRDSDGTGEWRIIPFDLNLSWGQLFYADYTPWNGVVHATNDSNKSHPLYGNSACRTTAYASDRYNRFYDAIISVPETRAMLLRRMRTLMDSYLQAPGTVNGVIEAQLDAHVARIAQEAALDRAKWGWPPDGGPYGLGQDNLSTGVSELKNLFLTPRRSHFFNTHTSQANVGIANGNSAGIPSTPQPAGAALNFAGFDVNPAGSTTQNEEYVQLSNPNGYAVDLSGWTLRDAVDFTFKPGTVVPAGGSIYVSPKVQAFRARTVSPRGGEGRQVTGPYKGQLSARGESITLWNAAGTQVGSGTIPANPLPTQQFLRVTELNYAPSAPTPAEAAALAGVAAGDFEFIELQNLGGTSLDLTGARFEQGIAFTFPAFTLGAGARCVLVANVAAFQKRYGAAATIAGVFAGNLNNAGETLQLVDRSGENILEFTYDGMWFPPANGGGRTLVARAAMPDFALYSNANQWALSGAVNGSPGAVETDTATVFEGWRWDYFTAADMPTQANPSAPASLAADPDGDGYSNFAEYAFGGNPVAGERGAFTTASVVTDGGTQYAAITFKRRHNALDVSYVVESCSDPALGDWAVVTTQVGVAGSVVNGLEQVTFREDNLATTHRFLRVRAMK